MNIPSFDFWSTFIRIGAGEDVVGDAGGLQHDNMDHRPDDRKTPVWEASGLGVMDRFESQGSS